MKICSIASYRIILDLLSRCESIKNNTTRRKLNRNGLLLVYVYMKLFSLGIMLY